MVNVTHVVTPEHGPAPRMRRITVAHQRFFQFVFTTQDNFMAHFFSTTEQFPDQ